MNEHEDEAGVGDDEPVSTPDIEATAAEPTDEGAEVVQGRRDGVATKGIVLFGGVVIVASLLLVWAFVRSSDDVVEKADVTTVSSPRGVSATDPRNDPNPRYRALIKEENAAQVEMAVTSGSDVVVPPLVGAGEKVSTPTMTATTNTRPSQRQERPFNPQALLAAMKQVESGWTLDGSVVLAGSPLLLPVTNEVRGGENMRSMDVPQVPLMRVQHAVLVSGVNTDYPSDVVAKITSGALRGARFLGRVQAGNSAVQDRVMLRFREMEWHGKTYQVDALAVDPGTRIAAIEGDINHHLIHNTLFSVASSYLIGYAAGISQGGVGALGVILPLNDDISPVPTQRRRGPGTSDVLRGQAAAMVGGQLGEMQYRGPTVTIPAGHPIGVIIVSPPPSNNTGPSRTLAVNANREAGSSNLPPNVTTLLPDGSVLSVRSGP